MIGFREFGYFWKLDKLFVWGLVDVKEKFLIVYLRDVGIKVNLFIRLKNYIIGL